MPQPDMKQVFSSHIDSVGYDADTQELFVQWQNGKTSVYSGVPPDLASEAQNAASIGSLMHDQIKGKFPHRYV